jgi:hypothetical protein
MPPRLRPYLAALAPIQLKTACSDSSPSQPSTAAVLGSDATPPISNESATEQTHRDASAEEAVPLPPISAQVSGAYDGVPFVAKGGGVRRFYLDDRASDAGHFVAGVSILVSQYESACTSVRDTTRPVLSLYLRSSHSELAPETFPIVDSFVAGGQGPAPQGTANIFGLDAADCGVHNFDQATAGTVTITSVAPGWIEATFDLSFRTSGAFAGTFSLPNCKGAVPIDDTDPTLKCVL